MSEYDEGLLDFQKLVREQLARANAAREDGMPELEVSREMDRRLADSHDEVKARIGAVEFMARSIAQENEGLRIRVKEEIGRIETMRDQLLDQQERLGRLFTQMDRVSCQIVDCFSELKKESGANEPE
jgi:hypothetical protein